MWTKRTLGRLPVGRNLSLLLGLLGSGQGSVPVVGRKMVSGAPPHEFLDGSDRKESHCQQVRQLFALDFVSLLWWYLYVIWLLFVRRCCSIRASKG
jgi:hypothetical protein